MNRSVICGIAGLAMMIAFAMSSVDSTSTAQAGCGGGLLGGLFKKDCGGGGGLFAKKDCGGGLFAKKSCGGGLFARLKARRAAASCCAPEPVCCVPEPVCCAPEPVCCTPEPVCAPAPVCCGTVTVAEPCCGSTPVMGGTIISETVIGEVPAEAPAAGAESASDAPVATDEAPPAST